MSQLTKQNNLAERLKEVFLNHSYEIEPVEFLFLTATLLLNKHYSESPNRKKSVLNPPGGLYFNNLISDSEKERGTAILNGLRKLEKINPSTLEGVSQFVQYSLRKGNDSYNELLRILTSVISGTNNNFSPGETFDLILNEIAINTSKRGGEWRLAPEISSLLGQLLTPKQGDSIYDPVSRDCSLLIHFSRIAHGKCDVFGQEPNFQNYGLGLFNLLLHGIIKNRETKQTDALQDPFVEKDRLRKFDIVAGSPPMGLHWEDSLREFDKYNRFYRGKPPLSSADYAYISHMLESARDNTGKVGIVTAHGVLFREGAEGDIRKQIIKENLLEAVIGLPSGILHNTNLPPVILLFNKGKKNKKVHFINASLEYGKINKRNVLREEDIQKIASVYRKKISQQGYSYLASIKEIEENGFNLNISRYVETSETKEPVDIKALRNEIKTLEKELKIVEKKLSQEITKIGFKD